MKKKTKTKKNKTKKPNKFKNFQLRKLTKKL